MQLNWHAERRDSILTQHPYLLFASTKTFNHYFEACQAEDIVFDFLSLWGCFAAWQGGSPYPD